MGSVWVFAAGMGTGMIILFLGIITGLVISDIKGQDEK